MSLQNFPPPGLQLLEMQPASVEGPPFGQLEPMTPSVHCAQRLSNFGLGPCYVIAGEALGQVTLRGRLACGTFIS